MEVFSLHHFHNKNFQAFFSNEKDGGSLKLLT